MTIWKIEKFHEMLNLRSKICKWHPGLIIWINTFVSRTALLKAKIYFLSILIPLFNWTKSWCWQTSLPVKCKTKENWTNNYFMLNLASVISKIINFKILVKQNDPKLTVLIIQDQGCFQVKYNSMYKLNTLVFRKLRFRCRK